jgi:hypothetical protein
MSKRRKNNLIMSLAENLSIIDMQFDDPKNKTERMKKLIETKPKLVSIDYMNILPNPPANNSTEVKEELQKLQKLVDKRKKDDKIKEMVLEIDDDADTPFKRIAKQHNLQFPEKLVDKLWNEVLQPIQMQLKWKYNRPRPYQLGAKLGIQIDNLKTFTHQTPSYPSGHAIHGYFTALVMEDMYPQHKDEWRAAGKMVGQARLYQGVHYPSDNDASLYAANKIWEDIKDKYKTILT